MALSQRRKRKKARKRKKVRKQINRHHTRQIIGELCNLNWS